MPMRFETPDYFTGDLVVTQQIISTQNPNLHGLYSYVIDVDGDNPPSPELAPQDPEGAQDSAPSIVPADDAAALAMLQTQVDAALL